MGATSARSWRHSGCNVRKKEGMRKQEKKKREERRKRAWRLGRSGFRSSAYNPCKIRGYSHPGRHPPAISLCLYLNTVHTHGLQFGVWSDTLEIAIQSLKKTKRKRKGKEKRKKEKRKNDHVFWPVQLLRLHYLRPSFPRSAPLLSMPVIRNPFRRNATVPANNRFDSFSEHQSTAHQDTARLPASETDSSTDEVGRAHSTRAKSTSAISIGKESQEEKNTYKLSGGLSPSSVEVPSALCTGMYRANLLCISFFASLFLLPQPLFSFVAVVPAACSRYVL